MIAYARARCRCCGTPGLRQVIDRDLMLRFGWQENRYALPEYRWTCPRCAEPAPADLSWTPGGPGSPPKAS